MVASGNAKLVATAPIQEAVAMPNKIDDLLPTAKQIQVQAALKEAEKADEFARRYAAAEAEK